MSQHVSLQIDIVALYLLTLSQMISSGLEVGEIIQGGGVGREDVSGEENLSLIHI